MFPSRHHEEYPEEQVSLYPTSSAPNYSSNFFAQQLSTTPRTVFIPHPLRYGLGLAKHETGSLDFLHQFAISQAYASNLAGSQFVGSFDSVLAEDAGIIKRIPLMFRCVWPPGFGSRHALINVHPSIDLRSLARGVDYIFGIVDSRGAIASTEIVWAFGERSRPETRIEFGWKYVTLGEMMNGIVEIHVESIEDALR